MKNGNTLHPYQKGGRAKWTQKKEKNAGGEEMQSTKTEKKVRLMKTKTKTPER